MKEAVTRYLAIAGIFSLGLGTLLMGVRFPNTGLTQTLLVAGAAMLIICAAINRDALVAFGGRRAARRGANEVVVIVLFTAVLVLIQAISVRNTARIDLTSNRRFTLAPQTSSVLSSLDRNVIVHAFYRHNSPDRRAARELLDRYVHESENVRYEFIDPDRFPDRAEALGAGYDEAVVVSGERKRVVAALTEEKLTNAIVQVSRPTFKAVYFVTGHGEKNVNGHERYGFFHAAQGLGEEGYVVRELSLVNSERVPEDCEVLIVAGPRRRYLSGEVDKMARYFDAGGAALFLLDPRVDYEYLASLLATYNIELLDAVVVDELVAVDGDRTFDATVAKVRTYVRHPITEGFTATTMFPRARPVRITPDEGEYRVSADYLAISEETSWGEIDLETFATGTARLDGDDIAGPLPVAAVAERRQPLVPGAAEQPPASRIVVIGDSDFAGNTFYGLLGNSDFFHNIVNYLAGDEDLINIRPREGLRDTVYITAGQGRLVFAICIVLLPLSAVVVGGSVMWKRRRR